jgi:integrase
MAFGQEIGRVLSDGRITSGTRTPRWLPLNPKVVSERLGHGSVAFTLDTYAHHARHAA